MSNGRVYSRLKGRIEALNNRPATLNMLGPEEDGQHAPPVTHPPGKDQPRVLFQRCQFVGGACRPLDLAIADAWNVDRLPRATLPDGTKVPDDQDFPDGWK